MSFLQAIEERIKANNSSNMFLGHTPKNINYNLNKVFIKDNKGLMDRVKGFEELTIGSIHFDVFGYLDDSEDVRIDLVDAFIKITDYRVLQIAKQGQINPRELNIYCYYSNYSFEVTPRELDEILSKFDLALGVDPKLIYYPKFWKIIKQNQNEIEKCNLFYLNSKDFLLKK